MGGSPRRITGLFSALLLLPMPALTERGVAYEARIESQTLRPTVADEARRFSLQSGVIELREGLTAGLWGDLRLGLPSMRFEAADTVETPRLGGHLLGFGLGGRHPTGSPLALRWNLDHDWMAVSGGLGEGDVEVDMRQGRAELGLDWQGRHLGIGIGVARHWLNGEETRRDEDGRSDRRLQWRPDSHAYLSLSLEIDDGGWVGVRHDAIEGGGATRLLFGRRF
ncbi:hypothetical protein VCB98_04880 [Gammaproteobacteria bacterium AB-CW1]|uniref:Uncharacterized protein n=1 Tax=Natronospira elongata TaxID=3110268 RepID=A0AAP6ML24_9GAMM|nr:hypothetical protein [Gammaproteobacteria bacterium AB-CW1]